MTTFYKELKRRIYSSLYNNYGIENYDEQRFGKFEPEKDSFINELKRRLKKIINYKRNELTQNTLLQIKNYTDRLQYIWERLHPENRSLLVDIIAFRLLGYKKIKLPLNTKSYWDTLEKAKPLKKNKDTIDPHFMHFVLEHFDLRSIGYDLELYFISEGIAVNFMIEQYACKINGKPIVQVEKGDYVLDIGGCWGDTALYFAHKAGEKGKVFSFEFIPDNIKIHNINTGLNPHLKNRIQLVEQPVSDISSHKIYFKDNGPGSKISTIPFNAQTGSTTTISIDDFIKQNNISKVDFIKMDIEGAEPKALEGALKTIKKFKPKLAIAIYHGMDDFVNIPKWLMDLNLGYDFYLGHYTIHDEETIIFAKVSN